METPRPDELHPPAVAQGVEATVPELPRPPAVRFVSHSPCTAPGCRSMQKIAIGCTHRRCKKHCLERETPCGFRAHDSDRRAQAAMPVPTSHVPAVPPDSTTPAHLPPIDAPEPRLYRTVMPPDMQKEWNTRVHERAQKKEAEVKRRHNLARIQHTFTVHAWLKDGDNPISIDEQGSATWPAVDLASHPRLLQALGMDDDDDDIAIERYHLVMRMWVNQRLGHAFKIRSGAHVLIRRIGVSICVNLEAISAQANMLRGAMAMHSNPQPAVLPYPTQPPNIGFMPPYPYPSTYPYPGMPSGAPAQPPLYHPSWLDPRLQQHLPAAVNTQATSTANDLPALDSAMSLVSATSAMSLSSDVDVLPSGDSAHSNLSHMSICPSPSSLETPETAPVNAVAPALSSRAGDTPQAALPPPPAVPQPSYVMPGCFAFATTQQIAPAVLPILPTPAVPDLPFRELDKLWDLKVVYTPPSMRPWPAGIFARDMARALLFIGDTDSEGTLQGPKTLAARFEYVFQGRPFKSATYQAQRVAWVNSTQEQREWIMTRPRTRDGLWTECRKHLTGWKTSGSHKRGKGKYRDDGGEGSEPDSD